MGASFPHALVERVDPTPLPNDDGERNRQRSRQFRYGCNLVDWMNCRRRAVFTRRPAAAFPGPIASALLTTWQDSLSSSQGPTPPPTQGKMPKSTPVRCARRSRSSATPRRRDRRSREPRWRPRRSVGQLVDRSSTRIDHTTPAVSIENRTIHQLLTRRIDAKQGSTPPVLHWHVASRPRSRSPAGSTCVGRRGRQPRPARSARPSRCRDNGCRRTTAPSPARQR